MWLGLSKFHILYLLCVFLFCLLLFPLVVTVAWTLMTLIQIVIHLIYTKAHEDKSPVYLRIFRKFVSDYFFFVLIILAFSRLVEISSNIALFLIVSLILLFYLQSLMQQKEFRT